MRGTWYRILVKRPGKQFRENLVLPENSKVRQLVWENQVLPENSF
jgi:hypothetical protein